MQAFIERIDIFPERREDGNWIQNIKFQFPVPIIKEGKEVAQIKGISLDKEKSDEHMVSLEKLSALETVYLLSFSIEKCSTHQKKVSAPYRVETFLKFK